uniref:RRM domain-containing protein n=1 Tax=Cebus imitator TaxID=2715852 RepID=A0A2K5RCN7_CEBIM
MVMENPSPLLVGREFVKQYYTLLSKAPECLHGFCGRNSSYVHGRVDARGKPQEAKQLCDGVVVQVMGLNFMQTFVLAPEGSVPNKFHVHNDMFRNEEEVFSDSEPELDEEDEVKEEQEERQPSPEPVQENANSGYYEAHPVTNGIEEPLEESSHEPEPAPESETKTEDLKPQEKSTPPPLAEPVSLPQEPPKPRVEAKPEVQSQPPPVHEQRPRPGRGDIELNDSDNHRIIHYPDSHQLFVGNLPHDIDENELEEFFMSFGNVELHINTKGVGGKLPNFGFVVFDDSEPVQRILIAKPIMFRGEVKKTRATRERETRGGGDDCRVVRRNDQGPGGPRGIVGGRMMCEHDGRGPPPRGGMAQKLGSGRGARQTEGCFTGQHR